MVQSCYESNLIEVMFQYDPVGGEAIYIPLQCLQQKRIRPEFFNDLVRAKPKTLKLSVTTLLFIILIPFEN